MSSLAVRMPIAHRASVPLARFALHAVVAIAAVLGAAEAPAADRTWVNTGASTAWLTGSNWSGGAYPTTGDIATFRNAGSATTAGINYNTLSGALSLQSIVVDSTRTRSLSIHNSSNTRGTLTLTGGEINAVSNVVLRNASGNLLTLQDNETGSGKVMGISLGNSTENVILLDAAGGITISSTITGANRKLTLAGSGTGTLTLSAANTYSGTNTLNNATSVWKLGNTNALGANGNALVMTTGTLDLASFSPKIGSLSGAGGRITNSSASTTSTVTSTSTVTGTFAGVIANGSGTTAFTKQGAGTLVFTAANTYTGLTTISGGVLQIGDGTMVGSITGNVSNSGTLSFNRSNSLAYSGTISGAGSVFQMGSGDTTLSAANSSYSGTSTLSAGTLRGGDNSAFGTGVLALNAGTITGTGSVSRSFANNVAIGGNVAFGDDTGSGGLNFGGTVGLGGSTRALTTVVSTTFAGAVTNGSLSKAGAATLSLTNAGNSFSALTVNAGTVSIGGNTAITGLAGSGGALNLAAGTLTLNQAVDTTSALPFSGSGGFTKTGASALTLTGNSSGFAGTTTVSAGTLIANGSLGGTVSVASSATLAGSGTVGAVAITTGATLSPGTSPGTLTVGDMTWAGGGNYNWQLFDATGSAGTGYDTISGTGALTINATSGDPFKINLWTLSGTGPDVNGNAINFSPTANSTWTLGSFSSISGFDATQFTIVTTAANGTGGFANTYGGTFSVASNGNNLDLVYTAPLVGTSWDYTATGGSWSTGGNWNPATVPSGTATLAFTGGGGTATNDITLEQISALTFTGSATGGYTLAGNAITLGSGGINNSSPFGQIVSANVTLASAASLASNTAGVALTLSGTVNNAGNTLTITGSGNTSLGVVTGTGVFAKTGSGTATLTAAVASPTVAVSGGAVLFAGSNLLADAAAVTVNGGSLGLAASNETVGSFTITSGSLTGSGTLTAATYALNGGTVAANLGAGTLSANAGATTLSGTAEAGTVNVSGGSLTTGAANLLSDAAAVTLSSGGLTLGGNDTVGSFAISGGILGGSATLTAATYALQGGTVAGNLGAGAATASSSTTTLNGTLACDLAVSGGSVNLGSADRLGNGSTVTISSGSLGLGEFDDTVGTFAISGGALGGAGTLTAATYSLGGGTVSGNLGAGSLTAASGAATLAGTSAAGTVTVSGGTLTTGGVNKLSDSAAVTLSAGGLTLGGSDTVGSFTISGGTLGGSGTLTAATYALQGGSLSAGLGAGGVNVSAGTTTLASAGRLAAAANLNVSSGQLSLGGNETVTAYVQTGGTLGGSGTLAAATYALQGGSVAANLGAGTVTVSAGTTTLASAGRFGAASNLTVSGGQLVLGGNETVAAYSQSAGTLGGAAVLTAGTYALTGGTVNATLGAGAVNISGGTTLLGSAGRLNAASTVTISGGQLALGGNETVGAYVQSAGTLGGSGTLTATSYSISGGTLAATLGSGSVSLTGGSFVAPSGATVANPITIGGMVPTVFYSQNFNGLGSGLPANWTTGTGATSAGLGSTIGFTATAVDWANSFAAFKNLASTTGLISTSGTAEQAASADRALGIRQTSSFGDPGAAFNYAFSTTGQTIDSVSLDLLMLSVQGRSTTWSVEYGLGASPTSFTTLGTWPDPNAWGSTAVTYSGTAVSGMSNQANVVFRVAAISGTATGSGSRDSMGIDNFQISNLSSSAASATLGITTSGSTTYSGPISITGTATLTAVAGGTATFSGIISGTAGSIIKTGAGTVILTGTNTYAAGTTVSAGTLKAGNSNSFGSGSVTLSAGATLDLNSLTFANTITNNGGTLANAGSYSGTSSVSGTADYSGAVGGTVVVDAGGVANFSGSINSLTVSAGGQANLNDGSSLIQATLTNDGLLVANRSSDTTFSTAIGGSGAFEKLGSGILTVTGNSTYSGATTVSAGRLKVNGSLGSGGLSVAASAWLMGTGTVNGPVTVSGTFSPGSSPGVITLGSLVLTSTSTTIIEVLGATRGTSYDGIDIATASGLTYGGLLSFEFGGSALADGTYDIFNFAGTSSGSFASLDSTGFYAGTWTNNSNGSFTLVKDAQTLTFSQSTGDIIVVPEPATLALAAIGACGLAAALRRRR